MAVTPKASAKPATRARRAWNFSSSRSVFLQSAFEHALKDLREFGCATAVLQTSNLSTLDLRPTAPPDLGTLPQAAITCYQFLKLKSGDLGLVNDPSSGSFSLSTFTCVTTASLPEGALLIAARFSTPRRLGPSGKSDDEGVRVPPMPIASKKVLNRDIMGAIASHPLASADLGFKLERTAELLFEVARKFESLARVAGSGFDQAGFASFLEDSGLAFETSIAKLPLGTAVVSGRVPGSNEQIKLILELTEKHVQFDFKGTETSNKVGLTELVTFGTCVWSVLAMISENPPLTSNVLGHFQVSAPTNTLLASRANVSLERGFSLVVPLLGELIHQALAKVNPTLKRASSAGSEALAQLEFASGKTVLLSSAPGTGAVVNESGQDAFGAWASPSQMSIEALEKSAAVVLSSAGISKGSGGKGVKRGGDAELIACRLKEPAKLRWSLGRSTSQMPGQSGGRTGSAANLEVIRVGGEKESLTAHEGTIDLQIGDEVRLSAAGGGAWGEPGEKEKPTT